MVNALEDYHTCTHCARPVHDYGPDADAINVKGQWFHRSCWHSLDDDEIPGDVAARSKIKKALDVAAKYADVDGAHHKQWIIDQMVRALTNGYYASFIAANIPYEWDEGIAP